MGTLEGSKKLFSSKTVHGNLLSILATIGSVAAVVSGGAPLEILVPAVTAAVGSIWGNLMSIFGRAAATQKIG
jgi:hypothetical protein